MMHGLEYRPAFVATAEEEMLLAAIAQLPVQEAKYKSYEAKRRIISFEADYPAFLLPLRERVGQWLGVEPVSLYHLLVTEYRPGTTLGWHRDMPQFGMVAGVSLAGTARMRFRPYPPQKTRGKDVLSLELEPRSAYALRGSARWRWQHSIAPTPQLRYSITFRTRR